MQYTVFSIGFQNQTLNEQYIAFLGSWTLIPDLQNPVFHTTKTKGDQATAAFNGEPSLFERLMTTLIPRN